MKYRVLIEVHVEGQESLISHEPHPTQEMLAISTLEKIMQLILGLAVLINVIIRVMMTLSSPP